MSEFDYSSLGTFRSAYDGASQSYRMEQKGLQSGDQDTLSARELKNLWQRSHFLCRNNAVAITAKRRLLANWIGNGITVRWVYENGTPATKVQKEWNLWMQECIYDGYGNLNNLQSSGWAGGVFQSGESFTRMVIAKRKSSRIPLALHQIEAEHLDPLFTNNGDGVTRNGITFENAKPSVYHFWKRHPGQHLLLPADGLTRVAVPAKEVVHIFERERPGQWRGVPMLTPVMLNIYEMDELVDATLQRQKAAQAVSWIIENTNPVAAFAPGAVRNSENDIDPATGQKRKVIQGIAGGAHYLNKGESVKFSSIQDIGSNLGVLLNDEWGKIAAALGLAAHQITGDLSEVNFSSIRAGLIELRIRVEMVQQHLFINLGMTPVCDYWAELFMLYFPRVAMTGVHPVFELPRKYGVDDLKDAQADLMEVQAGFATLESKLRERNTTFEEILADRKRAEASGIVFTSIPQPAPDPAPTNDSTSGRVRPTTANENNPTSDNGNAGKSTKKEATSNGN